MPVHVQQHSAVSCAKMAEQIEMLFGLWTRMGWRKCATSYMRGHIGATWRIQLNHRCSLPMCLMSNYS